MTNQTLHRLAVRKFTPQNLLLAKTPELARFIWKRKAGHLDVVVHMILLTEKITVAGGFKSSWYPLGSSLEPSRTWRFPVEREGVSEEVWSITLEKSSRCPPWDAWGHSGHLRTPWMLRSPRRRDSQSTWGESRAVKIIVLKKIIKIDSWLMGIRGPTSGTHSRRRRRPSAASSSVGGSQSENKRNSCKSSGGKTPTR